MEPGEKLKEVNEQLIATLRSLPPHARLILFLIWLGTRRTERIATGTLNNLYAQAAYVLKLPQLTARRLGQIIQGLVLSGLIDVQKISIGRYGRTCLIRTSVPSWAIGLICEDLSGQLCPQLQGFPDYTVTGLPVNQEALPEYISTSVGPIEAPVTYCRWCGRQRVRADHLSFCKKRQAWVKWWLRKHGSRPDGAM